MSVKQWQMVVAFAGITKPYNERILKDALLNNITKFLTELGTGRFFFVT